MIKIEKPLVNGQLHCDIDSAFEAAKYRLVSHQKAILESMEQFKGTPQDFIMFKAGLDEATLDNEHVVINPKNIESELVRKFTMDSDDHWELSVLLHAYVYRLGKYSYVAIVAEPQIVYMNLRATDED